MKTRFLTAVLVSLVGAGAGAVGQPAGEVFGHQVLPILQQRCLKCHGEGKTKGKLDLTSLANVFKGGESGDVIVPGKSRASLLWQQISEKEMPPKDEEPVTYDELQIIARWIDSSEFPSAEEIKKQARPNVHDRAKTLWSFHPPVRPALPEVRDAARVRTQIDRFVLAKLEASGAAFSPDADPRTLIRRVTFDLTGLPPTPEEVEAFVHSSHSSHSSHETNGKDETYEELIERLLASPHYGERWARHWLDVAGWAESSLLVGDAVRPGYWRYRDWVIRAFNDDKPFDQFVREQLAGDELVDWRNADRFDQETIDKLTATGFLRCTPDATDNQLITQEEKRFAAQQTAVEVATKALLGLTMNCTRCHDHKYDPVTQQEYYELIAVFQPAYDPEKWIPGMVNQFSAGPVRAIPIADRAGREAFQKRMEELGRTNSELSYQKENGIPNKYRDRYVSEHLEELPASFDRALLEQALTREERQRSKQEKAVVFAAAKHFNLGPERLKKIFPQIIPEQKENQRQQKQLAEDGQKVGEVIWALWDVSAAPSPTHLLTRGEFTKPAQEVQPGILRALAPGGAPWQPPAADPARQSTGRRLAFANWVTQPDHPLTARVMVNRVWQYHFGTGLVATPDDFGTRGAKPSHPELLDWLAREFIESGWSIKHLHRLILHSATYQQASAGVSRALPDSHLLAAFPRRRLEAEAIRDAMLSVGGLLDTTMFGESVPTKVLADGSFDLPVEHPGRHRRSVYLTTRRTQLPTFLTLFDAPSMDTNWPKRHDSAIAPQALALSNHPFVLECADAFAGRILAAGTTASERLECAFALAYGRAPRADEEALFAGSGEGARSPETERETWRTIAHALLASSEFLYLD